MAKFLVIIAVIIVIAITAMQFIKPQAPTTEPGGFSVTPTPAVSTPVASTPTTIIKKPSVSVSPTPISQQVPGYKSKVLITSVPFTSQAPFAEWKDPRFQEGCEEASSLMAVYWVRGITSIDKQKARDEIIAMAAYQVEKWGEGMDTSAKDTAVRILSGYFNFNNYEVKENISMQDIKNELLRGNLVIVPANGQALNNPHFTAPGPERHMIVIRGYDDNTGTFITNDPGIREGELYTYPQQLFYDAIRDYPTGYNLPIVGNKKVMIIVRKP